jgi:iron complex transport system substrate-binding protein
MTRPEPVRIASLLPSATEIVCALGLGHALVGVSHECDHPPGVVAGLPRLTRSAIPHGLTSLEIDREVSTRLRRGLSLYELDEDLLAGLWPDLLITQELCDVCAVSFDDVCRAASRLPGSPTVISLTPPDLSGLFKDIGSVAAALDCTARGQALIASLCARLDRVSQRVALRPRPTTFALEWLDPPFAAGHWVPEMIARAGGEPLLGRAGEKSFRVTWSQIVDARPEAILLIPCGYSAEAAGREFGALPRPPGWETIPAVQTGRVYPLDAGGYFSRPGPRIVEGIEILARVLHGIEDF